MLNIILNLIFLSFILIPKEIYSQQKISSQDSSVTLPILTLESLRNSKYQIGFTEDDPVKIIKLKNGYYEYPAEVVVEYGNSGTYGVAYDTQISCELNGDSLIDAIVVLQWKFGGAGTVPFIFPVINNNGIPKALKPFELEDRVKIEKIYKKKSIVYLDLIVHDKDDGLCCPTKKET